MPLFFVFTFIKNFMTSNNLNRDERALLHITLETVNLSLRKVFRELADCGPSCRKNVLKHLTELSTQLNGIEQQLSMGEWAKLNIGSADHRRHQQRKHQLTKFLKRRLSQGRRQSQRRRRKRSSSKTKKRR